MDITLVEESPMGDECGVSVAEVGCRGFAGQSAGPPARNHSSTQRTQIKVTEVAKGGCG